jgi:hypothetical protein
MLAYALGEDIEHVAHAGDPVRAAEAAVRDEDAVAFLGPLLSWQATEVAAILNEAGIAQLLPGATYSGLTRDEPGAEDGMPASLFPTGERTLFRIVPRDTAIARAVAAAHPRAALVTDESDYGIQVASQLKLVGLEVAEEAELTIYAGLDATAPLTRLRGRRVLAFEGAAQGGLPEALGEHARYVLPQRGGEGWSDADALLYGPQVKEAAMLVYGSAMAGGPTRAGVLLGLRSCGRFDEHGDTRERKVGVWRWAGDALAPDGILEDPGA